MEGDRRKISLYRKDEPDLGGDAVLALSRKGRREFCLAAFARLFCDSARNGPAVNFRRWNVR
jgi:hypothetical protein